MNVNLLIKRTKNVPETDVLTRRLFVCLFVCWNALMRPVHLFYYVNVEMKCVRTVWAVSPVSGLRFEVQPSPGGAFTASR